MKAPRAFSCRIDGLLREDGRVLMTRSVFRGSTGLAIRPVRTLYASEGAHLSTQSPIQIVSLYRLVERAGGELRRGGNGDDVLDLFWVDPARLLELLP